MPRDMEKRRATQRRSAKKHYEKYATPTWISWKRMFARCYQPNAESYPRYGGRGITICERWRSYENFLADMGERPEGTSLDRINNDGNYELGNCRWATAVEQATNTAKTRWLTNADGVTKSLSEWARVLEIDIMTLVWRLKRYDVATSLTGPWYKRRRDARRSALVLHPDTIPQGS